MDEEIIDKLPGDLKKLAELIGVENTLKIVDHWGGAYLTIPKCADMKREANIIEARRLYDAGGYTIRALALRFGVHSRTMMSWLNNKRRGNETGKRD